jgi:hypothetical protein
LEPFLALTTQGIPNSRATTHVADPSVGVKANALGQLYVSAADEPAGAEHAFLAIGEIAALTATG